MNPPAGMIQGGWEYVIASYVLTVVVLAGYALILQVRLARTRRKP